MGSGNYSVLSALLGEQVMESKLEEMKKDLELHLGKNISEARTRSRSLGVGVRPAGGRAPHLGAPEQGEEAEKILEAGPEVKVIDKENLEVGGVSWKVYSYYFSAFSSILFYTKDSR